MSVKLLLLKSTPASRLRVSASPPPAFIFILADDPSPFVVIIIVSFDPFDTITNPPESAVTPSILMLSAADPVCTLATPLVVPSKLSIADPDKLDAFNATLVELLPVIVFVFRSKSPVPVTTTLVRSNPVISAELSRFRSFKRLKLSV